MNICRPVLIVLLAVVRSAESCNVVGKRVYPYVHNVLRIIRYRNTPVECASGYTEVFESLLDEASHLVPSCLRFEEFRMLIVELEDLVCIVGKLEEVCLFACLLNRSAAVRALAVNQLALCPEGFTWCAVQTFVCAFINIALLIHSLPDLLDSCHVSLFCSSDEVIIRDLHGCPQILDACNDLINVLLRSNALLDRLGLDLLSVLIGTCQEHYVISLKSLESCHSICHYGAVCVTDVQIGARIIDRC